MRSVACSSQRPRILLGAYACQPNWGSESFVGWNRAVQASRFGQVDVILHAYAKEVAAIEAAVERDGLADSIRFHVLDDTPLERALQRVPGGFYPSYRLWQRRAYRLAQRLHAEAPFDLVHQATFCGYREPGELWKLDVPFVWGPVGGTQDTPAAFLDSAGPQMAVTERVRTALNGVQLRGGRVRRAAEAADVLLAANSTGKRDLERVLGVTVRQHLETGTGEVGSPKRWADRKPGPFRLLWAGVLNPTKGLHLMLGALEQLRAGALGGGPEVELIVVGDGPEASLLTDVPGVDWRGWIPRDDLLNLYADVDGFAFTSLRDTSGNVMLEALSAGLPVIYLDHQGAADVCSVECGLPVPVTTPDEVVQDLARAVTTLATQAPLYDRLSRGAIEQARALSWQANGDVVNALYAQVLGLDADTDAREGTREALLAEA